MCVDFDAYMDIHGHVDSTVYQTQLQLLNANNAAEVAAQYCLSKSGLPFK